ncbi:hypothetical protein GCM10009619_02570 [Williamsia maris]
MCAIDCATITFTGSARSPMIGTAGTLDDAEDSCGRGPPVCPEEHAVAIVTTVATMTTTGRTRFRRMSRSQPWWG